MCKIVAPKLSCDGSSPIIDACVFISLSYSVAVNYAVPLGPYAVITVMSGQYISPKGGIFSEFMTVLAWN